MESIIEKSRLKKLWELVYKNDNFPFLVLMGAFLIYHWLMQGWIGDDYSYSQTLNDKTVPEYMSIFWTRWASRVLVGTVAVIITHVSFALWKILDILFIGFIGYAISELTGFKNKRKANYIISCFIFMYGFGAMATAGWAVTTMTYLWPMACGIYAAVSIRYIYEGRKLKWYNYFLFTATLIYGANLEQMGIMMSVAFTIALIYFIIVKRPWKFICFQWVIAVIDMLLIFISPGNSVRNAEEAADCFPDFLSFGFLEKVELGYSSTLFRIITERNVLYMFLTALLAVSVWKKYRDPLYRAISMLPFAAFAILGFGQNTAVYFFPGLSRILQQMTEHGIITLANFDTRKSYISIVLFGMICAAILISIYILYGNTIKSLSLIMLIVTGFATRMALAFTPTIWKSDERTYLFMMFGAVICCVVIMYDFMAAYKDTKQARAIWYIMTIFASGCYLSNMLTLINAK